MSRTTNDGDSEKPPNTKGETEVLEELVAQLPSVPLTQYLSEQSDMEGAVFFKHQGWGTSFNDYKSPVHQSSYMGGPGTRYKSSVQVLTMPESFK